MAAQAVCLFLWKGRLAGCQMKISFFTKTFNSVTWLLTSRSMAGFKSDYYYKASCQAEAMVFHAIEY